MAKYSLEKKIEVVLYVIEGRYSEWDAAKVFQIPRSPIRNWVARYKRFGIEGLSMKSGSYSGEITKDGNIR